jgi:N-acetylglucosaminyl-diphospho-decaprenol L-rhamnosyltransferase
MAHSPANTGPDVTVVVVNYRSADLALAALAAVAASAGGLAVEEIVVDGASGGDEVSRLRAGRPGAEVVALQDNRGFAAGNNAGIARARGRHLLLLNPDALPQGDAVARLVAHLDAHPEVGVAAPLLRNEDGSPQDSAYRRFPTLATLFVDYCAPLAAIVRGTVLDPHNVPRRRLRDGPVPIAHATGAALLVRAEAARAAGPMDEQYFLYLEETEWQGRIAAAGWGREVVPGAVVVHLGGGSSDVSPVASGHFLDSISRYYRRPRAALTVVRVATAISRAGLAIAVALPLRSARVRDLHGAYGALAAELRRRR